MPPKRNLMRMNPTVGVGGKRSLKIISENKTLSTSMKNPDNLPIRSKITCACVLGGGAYGTALAQVMARGGTKVQMWVRETEVVESINKEHENKSFLKGMFVFRSTLLNQNVLTNFHLN
jgi:hypothetical protein